MLLSSEDIYNSLELHIEAKAEFGDTEELTEANFIFPDDSDYVDFGEATEEWDIAQERPGLWENIRRKKEREGKKYRPAKPGDKDRPDPDAWKRAQGGEDNEMAVDQMKKMHMQLMEIDPMLSNIEFPDWTKDMISKAELYIQNVYDFVKSYKPGKYQDEYEEEDEDETYAEYKYIDPVTGEVFYFQRKGNYKKNGRMLSFVSKAAEYQGRKVTLNKPFRTPGGPKKFAVYTKNESGNVVIVRFGDPKTSIKRDDPKRRKSFRARHQCDSNPGPKHKARYWSCRQWRSNAPVED